MYARIDDRFHSHPKAVAAGIEGRAMFVAGLCHVAAHLTDGIILMDALPIVAAEAGVQLSVAECLVHVGLWKPHDLGWQVVNYLDWNQSKEQVEEKRAADRDRQRSRRESRTVSRRDSPATPRGESSPVQSLGKPTSSSVLPVGNAHGVDIEAVYGAIADIRQRAQTGLRNPSRWRAKVRANLPAEVADRLGEVLRLYATTDPRVVAELVEGIRDGRFVERRDEGGDAA